ncbi:MAG: putative rRNA maturation factor [Flavobacteriaceae bacterium]|jgi:probable rRNA maturation factor
MHVSLPSLEIVRTTKGTLPDVSFLDIKEKILGKKYELSIAFIGPKEMQAVNKFHREKDYATNVLSFPLSDSEGEILICLSVARKEAKDFEMSYTDFIVKLLIHGMLHLKGFDHCEEMDTLENKYHKKFTK